MLAGGCPGNGCWRKPPRGVGDAAPYGLPRNGRQRKPAPHPALRGHLPPRGKARAVAGGSASLRGASGTPPPTGCPGKGGSERSRRGGGTPPYGWGYGNAVGFTWAVVSGPPRGRGRACPARGLRGHPSMVRPVGRGLDPSAGGYPGNGCWREVSRGVGDAAPYGLPGEGRQREPAPTPAAGPRCGAGGSGCSTSGLTKPAQYRRNPGRCRGGSRR